MCNKIYFHNKKEARQYIKSISKRIKGTLKPYKCQLCDGWHTTSVAARVSKRLSSRSKERAKRVDLLKYISRNNDISTVLANKEEYMKIKYEESEVLVEFDLINKIEIVRLK